MSEVATRAASGSARGSSARGSSGPASAASEQATSGRAWPRRATFRVVAGVAVTGAMFGWVVPALAGARWSAIVEVLAGVGAPQLAVLALLWAAGLVAHSFVLTGALPGLSQRRALTLSLTGSAVSNVAPMGGALGVATNLAMVRAWRFRETAFAAFTIVTNIWDVLAKLLLPVVALAALVFAGHATGHLVRTTAGVASLLLLATLTAILGALRSERAAARSVGAVVRVLRAVLRGRGEPWLGSVTRSVLETRRQVCAVALRSWPQLTAGMGTYVLLQAALLWGCLHVVVAGLPWYAVLTGFAVERLLSLIVVTPGGTGTTEAGTVAALVALGGAPLAVAAGVLLYRGFIFLLEIPVGGVWLGGWLVTRSRATRTPA